MLTRVGCRCRGTAPPWHKWTVVITIPLFGRARQAHARCVTSRRRGACMIPRHRAGRREAGGLHRPRLHRPGRLLRRSHGEPGRQARALPRARGRGAAQRRPSWRSARAAPSATSASGSTARSPPATSTTTPRPRPTSCPPSTRPCSPSPTARLLTPALNVPASMWIDEDRTAGVPHRRRRPLGRPRRAALLRGRVVLPQRVPRRTRPAVAAGARRRRGEARGGAKVADVGCGHGHSTVLMAEAFPNSRSSASTPTRSRSRRRVENAAAAGVPTG